MSGGDRSGDEPPLRISGEREFPLSPLTLPEASDVAAVEESGAGRLLLERARAVAPGFALTERTAPAIAQICRDLDGLPLALELAAAHARLLGPEALLARLDQAVQSPRSRELPGRQSTIRSMLDWSYALLTRDEQTALRRLSVFSGGFTFEAVEEVLGDDVDAFSALAGLVDQSMVLPRVSGTGSSNRFASMRPAASRRAPRPTTLRTGMPTGYARWAGTRSPVSEPRSSPAISTWFRRSPRTCEPRCNV
jgi:predicted ATPase